ncbi:MAG: hypothetical protein U5L45_05095 [Saprospiraceae bacterium]|nr:hypothetical protein [Saprospiraceae bacterium]
MLPLCTSAQTFAGIYEREKDFMSNPSVLILKTDGNFEISTGGTSVRGTYIVEDGKVKFKDLTGDYPDTMAGFGLYTLTVTGEKLAWKALKDKAIQRKHILTASNWRRIKG